MQKGRHLTELFYLGGIGYSLIEILWRGFTHWSMFFAGGIAFVGLGIIEENMKNKMLPLRWLTGSFFITSIEFIIGIIVNLILNLNVWDYSHEKGNLLGQICFKYSFFWLVICIIAMPASNMTAKQLAYYEKARYNMKDRKKPKKGFVDYAYCFRYRKQSCKNRRCVRGRNSICRLDSNRRTNDERAICVSNSRCSQTLQCADTQDKGCSSVFSSSSCDNTSSASYKTVDRNNAS